MAAAYSPRLAGVVSGWRRPSSSGRRRFPASPCALSNGGAGLSTCSGAGSLVPLAAELGDGETGSEHPLETQRLTISTRHLWRNVELRHNMSIDCSRWLAV